MIPEMAQYGKRRRPAGDAARPAAVYSGDKKGVAIMTLLKPRAGMRLTVAEFLELPDTWDRLKMELDEGALYLMPRPRKVHSFLEHRLYRHIEDWLDSFAEPPAELFSDFLVVLHLERRILLGPDLTIVLKGNAAVANELMFEGTPDIVIEILLSDRRRPA